jgi:hypothetical protein
MFNMALRKFSISDSGTDENGSFASEESLLGLETVNCEKPRGR